MKIETLSPSAANLYEQCPSRYKARYIDKKYSSGTLATDAGTMAHKILECYYSVESNLTPEEAVELGTRECGCAGKTEFEEAVKMAKDFMTLEPRESIIVLGTEVNFKFYLPSGANANGFIDRLDYIDAETVGMTDYKTGAFVPTIEELEEGNQTNLYPAWVFSNEDFNYAKRVVFRYVYLRTGEQKRVVITREMSQRYLQYFDSLYHAIARDERAEPRINGLCWTCQARGECREYKNIFKLFSGDENSIINIVNTALGTERVKTDADIDTLSIEEIAVVHELLGIAKTCSEKEKKAFGEWLCSYIVQTGNTPIVNGKKFYTTSKRRTIMPQGKVQELLNRHNLIDAALKLISPADLEKLVKGDDRAQKDFESLAIKEPGSPYVMSRKA